ncbi:MAG: acetyl-CoA carboxylase biotin carboxylase subunit [Methanocalculaceae archaeon]|jgi:pyruvate carboxylase subunit A|nr:acetyl-CoA carboxylase biotin carboxylase subunit [Methanocalculaceae archaeon]
MNKDRYFDKVLVANRGEIAIRVMRACREMGIETVAVYSEADTDALYVKFADEAFLIGAAHPTKSYLNMGRILEVAEMAGADAIHPGYGFLAEKAAFSGAVKKAGITFIGPSEKTIAMMGSKIGSKQAMSDAGVPVLPWTKSTDHDEAKAFAELIGYPVIVKASAGGGGIGMTIVRNAAEMGEAIEKSMRTAASAFGDSTVFIEKYLENPRHIEVQVFADAKGEVVHMFERECSIQRRHQKLIEEAPCSIMMPELRERMTQAAITVAKTCCYENAGTVEFLYDNGNYYFMEMNTRLQVEHTVTELITGMDMVRMQIEVAAGEPLPYPQDQITYRGHAIECRVNAEDPMNDFAANTGRITRYRSPGGPGVRIDSCIHAGYTIPPLYDSMIAKLCVCAMTRDETIARMRRALTEYVIVGVKTTLPLHYAIMNNPQFIAGNTHTHFLAEPEVRKNLPRYMLESETRMHQLADSLGKGKEKIIAATAAAVNVYLSAAAAKKKR